MQCLSPKTRRLAPCTAECRTQAHLDRISQRQEAEDPRDEVHGDGEQEEGNSTKSIRGHSLIHVQALSQLRNRRVFSANRVDFVHLCPC
jgi:hypothetical protein